MNKPTRYDGRGGGKLAGGGVGPAASGFDGTAAGPGRADGVSVVRSAIASCRLACWRRMSSRPASPSPGRPVTELRVRPAVRGPAGSGGSGTGWALVGGSGASNDSLRGAAARAGRVGFSGSISTMCVECGWLYTKSYSVA